MQIAKGQIGTVGGYDVQLSAGNLSLSSSVSAPNGVGSMSLSVSVSGKALVDLIFAQLPKGLITTEINAAIDAVLAGT